MQLQRKEFKQNEDDVLSETSDLTYVEPLEQVIMGRYTDFNYRVVPTEQGELLLEFLRRQLLSKPDSDRGVHYR